MSEVSRPPETSHEAAIASEPTAKETWETPEIVSFKPVSSAQGISYNPGDGISNLTP